MYKLGPLEKSINVYREPGTDQHRSLDYFMKPDSNHPSWPSASTNDVMLVQETMQVMGLYHGKIDGLAGTETLRAVRAYKKAYTRRLIIP